MATEMVVVNGVRYRSDEVPDENAPAEEVEWMEPTRLAASRRVRRVGGKWIDETVKAWP